jgi:hypothetical protein
MTSPRRPDDARLSTADLAAASQRQAEQNPPQNVPPDAQPHPARGRPPADREVPQPSRTAADARGVTDGERPSPLFAGNETDEFRHRWDDIQAGFVDEPRQAVERADALVAAAIKRLAEIFAHERAALEQQWARGDDVSTEDLRVALKRYRGFFDRLLSV